MYWLPFMEKMEIVENKFWTDQEIILKDKTGKFGVEPVDLGKL